MKQRKNDNNKRIRYACSFIEGQLFFGSEEEATGAGRHISVATIHVLVSYEFVFVPYVNRKWHTLIIILIK